jgi:tetratricopeptide (TPR) repeat protein
MTPKVRCKRCGEELEATVYTYINHLRRHEIEEGEPGAGVWLYRGLTKIVETAIKGLIFFLVVLLLVVLFFEFRKNQPIVTPFDVPSDLKDFTGVTVAEILIDEINNRISSAPSPSNPGIVGAGVGVGVQTARPEPVRFKRASPEGLTIKMEVGGISLDSFVSYFKGVFGKESEVISGNIIRNGDNIKIISRTNKKGPWSEEGREEDLEVIIEKLAEEMAFDMAPNYLKSVELARFYSNNGRYEEADITYRKITTGKTEEKPENLKETYIEWGRVLSRLREREEAENKYKEACRIAWDCDESFKECLEEYRKADQDNKNSDVLVEWGVGLSIMGDSRAAIKKYKLAKEINPKNPRVYAEWGYELFLLGDNEGAISKFQEFDKDSADLENSDSYDKRGWSDLYNNWGLVLDKTGRYEEAIGKFKKATQIDSEYYQAYYNWGLDLYNLAKQYDAEYRKTNDMAKFNEATNKYYESISKYRRALHINSNYVSAYNNLGLNLNTLEKYEEAIRQYKRAIEIDPNYHLAYYNWGYTLEKQKKYSEAIEKYKRATEINPNYSLAHYSWGYVLEQLGNYPEAVQKYKDVIKIDPNDVYAYEGWAIVSEAILKEAKSGDEAERIKGELAQAYEGWGRALEKAGNYEEADKKYKKADELRGFSKSKAPDIGVGQRGDIIP